MLSFSISLSLSCSVCFSFFPFLSICPFLISRRKFSTEWEHPWRRQYVLSLRSLCLSSLSRMQFSTEWDINGGVMLTDWPEEFEEASEQNLADTNLVVNSGQYPVGKKKNIRTPLAVFGQSFNQWHRSNRFIVFVIFRFWIWIATTTKFWTKTKTTNAPAKWPAPKKLSYKAGLFTIDSSPFQLFEEKERASKPTSPCVIWWLVKEARA